MVWPGSDQRLFLPPSLSSRCAASSLECCRPDPVRDAAADVAATVAGRPQTRPSSAPAGSDLSSPVALAGGGELEDWGAGAGAGAGEGAGAGAGEAEASVEVEGAEEVVEVEGAEEVEVVVVAEGVGWGVVSAPGVSWASGGWAWVCAGGGGGCGGSAPGTFLVRETHTSPTCSSRTFSSYLRSVRSGLTDDQPRWNTKNGCSSAASTDTCNDNTTQGSALRHRRRPHQGHGNIKT